MNKQVDPDIVTVQEVREIFSDRRWTIMGALLGTCTAILLVHSLEADKVYSFQRELGLGIVASTMPFQIVYCALHLFARENEEKLLKIDLSRIGNLSVVCQIISYGSAIGILIMWYGISSFVGPLLVASSIVAFLTVRFVLYSSATNPDNESSLSNSISNTERVKDDRHYSDSNHRPW
ncbi:MAG: hypothetical protein VXW89_03520 [Candidatus Thermoplasmatota archaeon]|nr:hypothetical protein [Candidatus Thermoplasmatota archaeon]MEC8722041.1 hypothetical protein [Candidatus Thermoplasmatota archaeon]MED5376000.1 hypothetical protein [Candidatus Thermoplasmatota archaeon]MEE3031016.1 hypothetical protein [Candidatus Thermoplasmatota archaeon]